MSVAKIAVFARDKSHAQELLMQYCGYKSEKIWSRYSSEKKCVSLSQLRDVQGFITESGHLFDVEVFFWTSRNTDYNACKLFLQQALQVYFEYAQSQSLFIEVAMCHI